MYLVPYVRNTTSFLYPPQDIWRTGSFRRLSRHIAFDISVMTVVRFQSITSLKIVHINMILYITSQKKFSGNKSHDRSSQFTSPKRKITRPGYFSCNKTKAGRVLKTTLGIDSDAMIFRQLFSTSTKRKITYISDENSMRIIVIWTLLLKHTINICSTHCIINRIQF